VEDAESLSNLALVRRLLELIDRVEDEKLADEIAVAVDAVLLRWAPPALRDVLWPLDRTDRAMDDVRPTERGTDT
jgi:hypothetical protein